MPKREKEWTGPLWKHPYMLYLLLTALLFALLLGIGAFALQNDLIPRR